MEPALLKILDRDWVYASEMGQALLGDTWKTGDLYPLLARLEREGKIESRWDPESPEHPRRRQYRRVAD